LSASLGVATNKQVAKVASDYDKPGGLTVVRSGEEAAFLAPLPVRVLWGVGPKTAQKLTGMGITTVGELAQRSEEELGKRFGKRGSEMAQQARGIDERPLIVEHERKSVSQERTFAHDLRDARSLRGQLWKLSQGVARHLQKAGLAAGTIGIKLRYSDFETLTRQMSLSVPIIALHGRHQDGAVQVLVAPSAKARCQPVHFLDPIPVIIEHGGVGAVLIVRPDLFGGQTALFVATFYAQQNAPSLVHAIHAEHGHRFGVARFIGVAPGGEEGELHRVVKVDLESG
jgi:hypothetical protein